MSVKGAGESEVEGTSHDGVDSQVSVRGSTAVFSPKIAHSHVPLAPSSVSSRCGPGARVFGVGAVARRVGRSSASCCPCCGLDLVDGNGNICGDMFGTGWV